MSTKKAEPPADDFGGYPGDAVDLEDEKNADARREYIEERLDRGDGGQAHIDPDWDIDLDRAPTKGERRIIELTLRALGTAGAAAGLTAGEALSELAARTSDMLERLAKTLHDGVDEVFAALAEAHTQDEMVQEATSKAREAAHKMVDELVQDLRGEGDKPE